MKEKKMVSRRSFIQKSAGAAALLTIPTIIPANVFGANDKVSVTALGTAGATLAFAPDLFANNEIEDWDPNKPFIVSGKELKVQPILIYSIQERKEQTSWKSWGSIRSEQSAAEEAKRITQELSDLSTRSGVPLQILP